MKKLLFVFALMLGVASCGNSASNVSEANSTAIDSIDSISVDTIDSIVVDSVAVE